ncbi:MAG: PKD domain-containing protein, partial [Crocinitomicaceae bacterium]|nr:PKD domain-containing protein [Crocinitomicaceae bacterium]
LNTSTNASTFQWDFGDGASSVAVSPQHAYLTVGFYDVQLIAASNAGCLDTVSQIIEVREPPIANFSLSPDSACAPVNVSFSNSSTGIAVTYAWDFGNGNTSTQQHPSNQVYQQGYEDDSLYTIYLTVSNFCGVETDSATVRAMPQPVAVFAPFSDVTCDEFPLEFVNNSYGLPDGYFWDFGNGTSTTSDTVFTHSFQGSSTYDTSYTI